MNIPVFGRERFEISFLKRRELERKFVRRRARDCFTDDPAPLSFVLELSLGNEISCCGRMYRGGGALVIVNPWDILNRLRKASLLSLRNTGIGGALGSFSNVTVPPVILSFAFL